MNEDNTAENSLENLSRKDKASRTRERIVDTAMKRMSNVGYSHTRLEDVAADLGMTRGAIYGHFPSKAALYKEILEYSESPLSKLMLAASVEEGPAREVIRNFMHRWFELLLTDDRHRYSTEIFLNKSEMIEEVEDVYQRELILTKDIISGLTRIVKRGVAEGSVDIRMSPRMCAIQIYGHLMGIMQTWLFNPQLFSLTANTNAIVDVFIDGILGVSKKQHS